MSSLGEKIGNAEEEGVRHQRRANESARRMRMRMRSGSGLSMRNSTLLCLGLSSSKDRTTQLCSQRSMKYTVRAMVARNNASHCDSLSCSHFTKGHSCIYACVVKVQGREETTSMQYLGLREYLSWPSLCTSPSSQAATFHLPKQAPFHLTQQPGPARGTPPL
jgi:hypothetical protein